ncbi:hypothetical protein [Egicoccus sp. AB-alg6-2]|uniref:hypothetical protein n=1 Tax=Egicoccus sp. AB-alg6-2 TaxID=3242692 RepID=UPI00359EEC65
MLAVGLFAVGIVVWIATVPNTVRTADMASALVPIGPGETYYEGYYALNDRDIVVEQVTAVATPGVTAEPLLCDPVPDVGYIGNITSDELHQFCSSTDPVVAGTVLPGHSRDVVQPYVLVRITKHTDSTEAFCGLDITYRDRWRHGTNRQARHPPSASHKGRARSGRRLDRAGRLPCPLQQLNGADVHPPRRVVPYR